jgi:hypothetical protein
MPAELTDLQRALALLRYPVPGQTEHRVLADFLAALGRFELPHAAAILLGMMSGREQTDSRLSVRLRALLTIMAGLLQESARNPRQVADQLRLWLPEAQKSRQRERLLADLLSPPDEVAARQV